MGRWYENLRVVGQVNLSELDAESCDVDFWADFWRRTGTDAIVVNAGGIAAFYPSRYADQARARFLGKRDLVAEFVRAARKQGLAVIARMDVSCVSFETAKRRPEWIARKKDGEMYASQGRAVCCVNGDYYKRQIPDVLRELCERYHPEGFADNSWTGLRRDSVCYCARCREKFRADAGCELPEAPDYDDPVYRRWIRWSYRCRLENWDLFNETVRDAGGEDTLWMGMINANFVSGHAAFCDLRELAGRAKMLMVDHQSRDGNGFEQNSFNGKLLHQLAGWDCPVFESMAAYVRGMQAFRHAANPPAETRLWMAEGFAGGIRPWWHVVGARQDDRRVYSRVEDGLRAYRRWSGALGNRRPLADVGVVWSQENVEFYGREAMADRVELAMRGVLRALTRAGLSFLPVHADDVGARTDGLRALILPEMAALSDRQAERLRAFVESGGGLLAIGPAGVMDETGAMRERGCLEGLLGVGLASFSLEEPPYRPEWNYDHMHDYLRIQERDHPIFRGFEETDTLPMGAFYRGARLLEGARALAGYIPPYPLYPPEFSWRRLPERLEPAIVERVGAGGGRCLSVPWALDRAYGRLGLPDHGDLLANMVRYLMDGRPSVEVRAEGYVDLNVYRRDGEILAHLVNLSAQGFHPGYAERCIPVEDVRVVLDGMAVQGIGRCDGADGVRLTQTGARTEIWIPKLREQAFLQLLTHR